MRDHAIKIFQAAVHAVTPQNLISQYLQYKDDKLSIGDKVYDFKNLDHIYLVAAGKAASAMALEAERIIGDQISESIVVTKYEHSLPIKSKTIEAGHPVPDKQSLAAGKKVLELLARAGEKDLVILLLSGGASSLMESLPANINLQELQMLSESMLRKGLSISEINTIRKHLSGIKGGQFSAAAYPAKVHSLILSDVPGDDLSVIASGPTVPDPSSFEDVITIFEKYQMMHDCPKAIFHHVENGRTGSVSETPKPGDSVFNNTANLLIGSNRIALNAAMVSASKLGYNPVIINPDLKGEASDQASEFIDLVLNYKGARPACLLMGGETTVTIKSNGMGGRNQEFALASLIALHEVSNVSQQPEKTVTGFQNLKIADKMNDRIKIPLILSAGTDGTDGPTDATGAVIDAQTMQLVEEKGIDAKDFLNRNDSYSFFKKVGGHIKTGPTQTNVMDIVIALVL